GVGQVEDDFRGSEPVAFEADTAADFLCREIGVAGLGFESTEDGTEGAGRGDGFEFLEEVGDEPVAEGGGAEGLDAAAVAAGGEAGAGLAVVGVERGGGTRVVEEGAGVAGFGDWV